MAEAAELYFSANAKEVVQAINGIQGRLRKLEKNGSQAGGGVQTAMQKSAASAGVLSTALAGISFAGLVAGALKAAGVVKDLASAAISAASEMETYNVRFSTLLGNQEKAQQHVARLTEYAAKTPFDMAGISKASATLLAFGVEARESMEVLRMLGDVAAASGGDLGELARIYGKVATAGKMDTADINQLADRGLNVRAILAARDSLDMGTVKKNISSGVYGLADLRHVLASATGEGGAFAGGAEKLSGTLEGRWSTLSDNIKLASARIGDLFVPALKSALSTGVKLVDAFSDPLRSAFLDAGRMLESLLRGMSEWSLGFRALEQSARVVLKPFKDLAKTQLQVLGAFARMDKMASEPLFRSSFDEHQTRMAADMARLTAEKAEQERRAAEAAERSKKAAQAERDARRQMRAELASERAEREDATDRGLFSGQSAEGMRQELAFRYKQATGEEWRGSLDETAMQRAEDAAATALNKGALAELQKLREFQKTFEKQQATEIDEKNKRDAALEAVRVREIDDAAIYEARAAGNLGEVQRIESERTADAKFDELLRLGMSRGEAAQTAAAYAGRQHGFTGGKAPGEWVRDDLAAVGGGGAAIQIPSAQLQVQQQQLAAAQLANKLLQRLVDRPETISVTQ